MVCDAKKLIQATTILHLQENPKVMHILRIMATKYNIYTKSTPTKRTFNLRHLMTQHTSTFWTPRNKNGQITMNITYPISILLYKSQNTIIIYHISRSKRHVLIKPKSKRMSPTNRHNEKKRRENSKPIYLHFLQQSRNENQLTSENELQTKPQIMNNKMKSCNEVKEH